MTAFAVAITAREQAELVPAAVPETLEADEIRGRTVCTLISPGTEIGEAYCGKAFPRYPGYAAAFTADDIGDEVRGVSRGDLVFCMGPHRSFQRVKARDAHRIPEGLPAEKAVLARLMSASMSALMTTAARPGDRVMVTGAGPVGYLATQIFAHCGYELLVAEPDGTRRSYIEQSGIPNVFGTIPRDGLGIAGAARLVVECSGHEQAVMDACKSVRKRGEVVLVGFPWVRRTDTFARELLTLVFQKCLVLRSGWEWQLPPHRSDFRPYSVHSNIDTALHWLASGCISIGTNLIAWTEPQAVQDVYQNLLHSRSKGLFTVIDWSKTPG